MSLQRLSNCLQSVLQLLECPVCLETIPPPAFQCCHGHVLCGRCRSRADKCPVCRVSLGPKGRCLLADKLHNLLTSVLNQNHKKKQLYSKNRKSYTQIQQPFHLKSRITTEISSTTNADTTSQQAGSSAEILNRNNNFNSILVQAKASSEENISSGSVARDIEQLSSLGRALRTRSMSAEQIPITVPPQQCMQKPFQSNQMDELSFHCPYSSKSRGHCRNILIGSQALLKHIREDHAGPLIQYFLKPSRSIVKLRLPLSNSRTPPSSLTSFTTEKGAVFFVQVAAGATPGHRLVWLWLLGDVAQSERYRLRITLPEGDTHTGPVFPLTASWNEVVNSNCCLSIEESRYNRANPEVRLEIFDIGNK